MKSYISVPNLDRWQHYKDRCPPWIKLHRDILNNYEFSVLPDAMKAHVLGIWLLASQMDNKLPNDSKWLASRINATEHVDINLLSSIGIIEIIEESDCAINVLSSCKQSALAETEAEAETDTVPVEEVKLKEDPDLPFG